MITTNSIRIALAVLALTGGVFAYRAATRPDCPGKIVCPLTGEIICADKCPAQTTTVSVEVPACCKKAP